MSSIRENSSDSEASESSIEIQSSPAPRGLITKEPFKGPAGEFNSIFTLFFIKIDVKWLLLEVEATTPSNQMDLDQEVQVINSKHKSFSLE